MTAGLAKCAKIRHIVRLRQMLRRWRNKARMSANRIPSDVPAGHVAVCVGTGCRRFVVRATYLNHPIFKKLLVQAEEEFGFSNQGLLTIPCDENLFEEMIRCISRSENGKSDLFVNLEDLQRYCHVGVKNAKLDFWTDSRPLLHSDNSFWWYCNHGMVAFAVGLWGANGIKPRERKCSICSVSPDPTSAKAHNQEASAPLSTKPIWAEERKWKKRGLILIVYGGQNGVKFPALVTKMKRAQTLITGFIRAYVTIVNQTPSAGPVGTRDSRCKNGLDPDLDGHWEALLPAEILQPGLFIAFLQVGCELFTGGCHVNHVLHMQRPRLLAMTDPLTTLVNWSGKLGLVFI
ncbi:hypothetical protein POTOM_007270 [Populus tomentosa]|uniref:SAUR-like auxin-responsive protein family n=2 Tax=Populus TaxID=3689 RepID=A0A8X8AAC3_POPTO|nr:hypothetical protein POTOM_007270 [Populus tomentosa]